MDYRLTIAYRGTAYAGWQRQLNAPTIQQATEEAVSELAGESVTVVGAGRTDAGVHAAGQVGHVRLQRDLPSRALVHGVNSKLPGDIRVLDAGRIGEGFHPRKLATSKEYRYRLRRVAVLSPLDSLFAVRVSRQIDVAAMRLAAAGLVGRHDFSAFALAGGSHQQPFREIFEAEWVAWGSWLSFRVVGEGFLRGMVRSLVGTLLEVGRGRRSPEGFKALLAGGERGDAGPTAPAQGLVLQRVDYPPQWRAEASTRPAPGA